MKNLIISSITAISINCAAQQNQNVMNSSGIPNTIDFNKVTSTGSGKVLNYSDVQGSPYLFKDYKSVLVGDFSNALQARYNAYTDEVEIKVGDSVQTLPKEQKYSPIIFKDSALKLINIDDVAGHGYFSVIGDGKVKLLKKYIVRFVDEQPAQSSYATSQPAKFVKLKPVYFFYKDSKLVQVKKEVDLTNAFPTADLKSVIKKNKLKLDSEKDLLELRKILD